MLSQFGPRQQQLLTLLLQQKAGMTIDELAQLQSITRTAVNQHLAALERDGYVAKTTLQKTKGRPGQTYALTAKGVETFPKQYAWFSRLLLTTLKQEYGSDGLANYLRKVAQHLAADVKQRVTMTAPAARLTALVEVMNELSYEAKDISENDKTGFLRIEAKNCVYHGLAQSFPEVCQFDLALMSDVMRLDVEHESCIVRGADACRFRFSKNENNK